MKKTKFMTKVMAVVFALAILFAMSVPAWAAGDYNATVDPTTKTVITNNRIPLDKTIVFFNPENIDVREPNLTYTYQLSAATINNPAQTITDADGDTATVNAGILQNTANQDIFTSATTTISFAPTLSGSDQTVAATPNGTLKTKTAYFEVDPTRFDHAGVYRYVVTETTSDPAVAEAGVTRATVENNEIRYLDLYIKNGTNSLELQGAVFFKTNDSINGYSNNGQNQIYGDKTTGFDVEDSGTPGTVNYSTDTSVDKYFTYNLTVTKTTTGNMADKTHKFPIEVTLSKATGLTADATVDVSYSASNAALGSGQSQTPTLGNNTVFKTELANSGEFYIKGIPYFPDATNPTYATINSVKETNNTPDSYTPSVTTKTNLTDGSPAIAFSGNAIMAGSYQTTTGTESLKANEYAAVLGITNEMSDLSPTGLAFRVAPYVLMLAAGVSLIVLFAKRRREITDMI